MTNLSKLKTGRGKGVVSAVVETAKGSRTKLDYDVKQRCFVVSKVLPEGMSFPFDFGFIPSTVGGDGDPLDVIMLLDEPVPTGTLVPVRLIGVIEAEQTSRSGETDENDRLLAIAESSLLYEKVRKLADLPTNVVEQIEAFFESYNRLEDKKFVAKHHRGPDRAQRCMRRGRRRFDSVNR